MEYKSTPRDRVWAHLLGIAYVLLAIVLAVMLFKIWPPVPWPSDKDVVDNPAVAKALSEALACGSPPATSGAISEAGRPTPVPTPKPTPTNTPDVATLPGTIPQTTSSPVVTPSPTPIPLASQALVTNIPIKFYGRCISTTFDERLILLVIIAGILGSFVHAATSLADFIGNENFNKNWTWFYLLRPAIGMALALVFYFVIRGGFLTTSGGAKDINPYGIAALAGLVGMFSKQATDKLSEVFSTLFRSAPGEGDEKRRGSLKPQAVTVTTVNPVSLPKGSAKREITITGANFIEGAIVRVNDIPQKTNFVSATQLTAEIDEALLSTPAILKLKVLNEGGPESAAINFTVTEA